MFLNSTINSTIELLSNSVRQLFIFSVLAGMVFIAVVVAGIAIAVKLGIKKEQES
jgi:hypothetical protein